MRRVTKENLITQIDRLYKIKDEQGQLSMNGEYNLQVYKMLLTTMDAEPVGEFYEDGPLNWYQISPGDSVPDNRRIPLYRHAKPALAVPAALPENDDEDEHDIDYLEPSEVYALGRTAGWNACRAAMLNKEENNG